MENESKIEKAIVTTNLNDLLFPVEKVNFSERFGMSTGRNCDSAIIGHINGQDKVLYVGSDRYQLVPNVEIFPAIRAQLQAANVKFEESYKMRKDAIFTADYRLIDQAITIGDDGDGICPQIKVMHSYNGEQKYMIVAGYFRFVCTNGLIVPVSGQERPLVLKGKHTASILQSIGQLMDFVPKLLSTKSNTKERFEVLFDTKVENYGDRVSAVMEAVDMKKGLEDIVATIRTEMGQLQIKNANDWLVYNAVNRELFDESKNVKRDEERMITDRKVYDWLVANPA
jgi:hypothetical protein